MKFLTLFLSLIERLFTTWDQAKLRQEGRRETIKEANDAINRQIELGEAASSVLDAARDERLRNRFDRSRSTE